MYSSKNEVRDREVNSFTSIAASPPSAQGSIERLENLMLKLEDEYAALRNVLEPLLPQRATKEGDKPLGGAIAGNSPVVDQLSALEGRIEILLHGSYDLRTSVQI